MARLHGKFCGPFWLFCLIEAGLTSIPSSFQAHLVHNANRLFWALDLYFPPIQAQNCCCHFTLICYRSRPFAGAGKRENGLKFSP